MRSKAGDRDSIGYRDVTYGHRIESVDHFFRCSRYEDMQNEWQHLKHPVKIERRALHDAFSSRETWLHLDAPFLIRRTQFNGVDSYLGVSSRSLIEDQSTY